MKAPGGSRTPFSAACAACAAATSCCCAASRLPGFRPPPCRPPSALGFWNPPSPPRGEAPGLGSTLEPTELAQRRCCVWCRSRACL